MTRLKRVVPSLLLLVLALPAIALAQEVAAPVVEKPVWYGDVKLWELLATVIVVVWGAVKAKYRLDEKKGKELTELLELGAQKAYDEFVRDAKLKNPKGKLTAAQIREARDRAWEAAKVYGKQRGIDLAKKVAAERIPVLIGNAVNTGSAAAT